MHTGETYGSRQPKKCLPSLKPTTGLLVTVPKRNFCYISSTLSFSLRFFVSPRLFVLSSSVRSLLVLSSFIRSLFFCLFSHCLFVFSLFVYFLLLFFFFVYSFFLRLFILFVSSLSSFVRSHFFFVYSFVCSLPVHSFSLHLFVLVLFVLSVFFVVFVFCCFFCFRRNAVLCCQFMMGRAKKKMCLRGIWEQWAKPHNLIRIFVISIYSIVSKDSICGQ